MEGPFTIRVFYRRLFYLLDQKFFILDYDTHCKLQDHFRKNGGYVPKEMKRPERRFFVSRYSRLFAMAR